MLPEGWVRHQVGDICTIVDCVNKTAPVLEEQTPYKMIRTSNVRHGRVDVTTARFVSEETFRIWTRRGKLRRGDIILTREAPLGEVGLLATDEQVFLGQRTVMFRAHEESCDNRFLYFSMLGGDVQKQIKDMGNGGTVEHVRVPDCGKFLVKLPPLPEQKKIADILSTWDASIETTAKLLANAESQKRALMQQLLTGKRRLKGFEGKWKAFSLGELAEINPRRQSSKFPDRCTFLAMDCVREDGSIAARPIRPTSEVLKGFTAFQEGDVLVAKITPCFENGKGCHAVGLENGIGFGSTEFHVVRATDERDQRLIQHITQSWQFRGRGKMNMQGSAGQQRIPPDFISDFSVRLPTNPAVREEIGQCLDVANDQITHFRKSIEHFRAEKRALMQQLLTGKRRVKL